MKLNRPKEITFWIAVVIVLLGIMAHLGSIPGLAGYAFWMVVGGFVLLALGNLMHNL